MMSITVTGANGQVGFEIVKLAAELGFTVDATSHESLDITDYQAVRDHLMQTRPAVVINAAAYTAVDRAEEDVATANAVNAAGPRNLAGICEQLGIPLLHISTDYVYDGCKDGEYVESDTPRPLGIYGSSKLEGDRHVAAYEKSLILRVSWVFGQHGNNFVKSMLRIGSERERLGIVNDQRGAPTFSSDIALVLLKLCKRFHDEGELPWGLYHYAGDSAVTWFQFAEQVFTYAEKFSALERIPQLAAIETKDYPTPAKRPHNSVLNCDKFKSTFGLPLSDWKLGAQLVVKNWTKE